MLPVPLPTVRPDIEASLVTVKFVSVCAPDVRATVPVRAGNVIVFVPATAGAATVMLPDVSPLIITELIVLPTFDLNLLLPIDP
jgi:hypothetical protein